MSVWFSPFDLEPSLPERLRRCGWMPCEPNEPLPEDAVVFYVPPDQLLAAGSLDPEAILDGYQQLLGLEHPHRLISTWRLAALTDAAIQDGPELNAAGDLQPPQPEPLTAVVTRLALDALPALLEAYLDLELEADLLGGEPDAHYRRRLLADLSVDELLQAWRAPSVLQQELSEAHDQALKAREAEQAVAIQRTEALQQELSEAREEAELTLLQLHQVQEELEHYFLQSREQAKQLEEGQQLHEQALQALEAEKSAAITRAEALQHQIDAAQQQREQALQALEAEKAEAAKAAEDLKQQLMAQGAQVQEAQQARDQQAERVKTLDAEKASAFSQVEELQQQLSEAREEAELTLLQLHQVQEELEHYFLLSRGQVQQLERYDALLRRSEGLLSAAAR